MNVQIDNVILAIITVIGAILGGAGFWNYWTNRRRLKRQENHDRADDASKNSVEALMKSQLETQAKGTVSAMKIMQGSIDFLQVRLHTVEGQYIEACRQLMIVEDQLRTSERLNHQKDEAVFLLEEENKNLKTTIDDLRNKVWKE